MTSPTHVLIGLSTMIAFSRLNGIAPGLPELLMMLLGSLLPDIDIDGAVISRPGGIFRRFMPWQLARLLDSIGMIISKTINLLFGHRGFIHAPIIGLSLIFYGAVAAPLCFWLGWGYFWHIVGDAMTVGGVPLLSPVSAKKYSFRLCRTNSVRELLLAITLLFYVVIFGFTLLPEKTKIGFRTLFHLSKAFYEPKSALQKH